MTEIQLKCKKCGCVLSNQNLYFIHFYNCKG